MPELPAIGGGVPVTGANRRGKLPACPSPDNGPAEGQAGSLSLRWQPRRGGPAHLVSVLATVGVLLNVNVRMAEAEDKKVDQVQSSEGGVAFGIIRTTVHHAQQFVPAKENLKGVSFFVRRLKRGNLSTTADLKVSLRADNKDEPGGEELASVVVPYQSVKENENCWVEAALSHQELVPGRKYWLVFTIAGQSQVPKSLPPTYILEGDYDDAYPKGLNKYYGEHSDIGYPVKPEVKNSWKDWEFDFSFKTYH